MLDGNGRTITLAVSLNVCLHDGLVDVGSVSTDSKLKLVVVVNNGLVITLLPVLSKSTVIELEVTSTPPTFCVYVYVTRALGVPVKVIGVVLFKQIVAAPEILAVGNDFTSMVVVEGCNLNHPFASRTLTNV
jgi:hypothetical protein